MNKNTCQRHHTEHTGICPVCSHRDSYMVRGSVTIFDEGYEHGYQGLDSRVEAQASHGAKADYEDGYKHGTAERKAQQPKEPSKTEPGRNRRKRISKGLPEVLTGDAAMAEVTSFLNADRDRLMPYFEMISNPSDWKAPIDTVIPKAAQEKVEEAIAFFTATEATFHPVPDDPFRLRVVAEGYRRGPAGDH